MHQVEMVIGLYKLNDLHCLYVRYQKVTIKYFAGFYKYGYNSLILKHKNENSDAGKE